MICQNCQKGFQAAAWRFDQEIYDGQHQPIHLTCRSFLESILLGCPVCHCAWRHIVQTYKKKYRGVVDASLPNHDEVQGHLKLIRRLAQAQSLCQDTDNLKPAPTLCDATAALVISDDRSEDESEMSLIQQLWQQTTPVPDPLDESCPVVVQPDDTRFDVSINLLPDSERKRITGFVSFNVIPITRRDIDLERVKAGMGGYGAKACTSANPKLWKLWMGLCMENHDECNKNSHKQPSFFPRRLVEINSDGNSNPTTWRVKQLVPSEKCPYLTLSHCWGTFQHPHKLTRATHQRFLRDGGPVSELPKTFREAMSIALSVGFRYVWIDSLCIIQDDVDDWRDQSSVMGLIYKHAACNIAATWASNAADGCFSPRNPADVEPGPWRIKLPKGPKEKKKEFRVVRSDYETLVEDSPLNTRGWVLQERCLSPRQLQFTKDEVYWECSRYIASERFPTGMPKDEDQTVIQGGSLGKPRLDHHDKDNLREAWAQLVQQYSLARLTIYTDKTIAFAGLANEIRERHRDEYLAGLWRKRLHRQLCWSVDTIQSYKAPTRHFRGAGPYIAPTWSWMSADSVVTYDERYLTQSEMALDLAQVLSASVRSSHPSRLHSFVDGSLQLRAMGIWCRGVADMDRDFETTHVLRQPRNPDKRSDTELSELLLGWKIDIIWDEGVVDDEEMSDDDSSDGEELGDDEESSGDEEWSDGEESGDDGWSTCSEDNAVVEDKGESVANPHQDVNEQEGTVTSENHSEWSTDSEDEGLNEGNEDKTNGGPSQDVLSEEKGIGEDGLQVPQDSGEQMEEPLDLAREAVRMRQSDLLLALVYLDDGERQLGGLVLADNPRSSTEFVRLGVFRCSLEAKKGGRPNNWYDVVELFKSRLGWDGRTFTTLEVARNLGDARCADIVHTVTIV